MPAPEIIHQLVAKFNENREAYRSGKYNEARLRQEFLDQFFIALGWDVYNTKGAAPQYADVEIETSLDIEGTLKSPDYTFRVGPERKFFVEAKKPAVNIQYDIHPAYQLKRYAWNAHLPISILTDFEEFAVYNCKQKPNPSDSPAAGRELFIKYTEYIERWDEIAGIFSREAVWKGALDRYADTSKGKKGTTEVDDEFLKDMNEWRLKLARNIALRNSNVADEQQLNYAVQMTIDRVIFLRICEDRGIEPEEQLKALSSQPGVYARLLELFKRADLRYNSGLFNFTHDKDDNTPPDTFTPALAIDDRVLKEIISGLYYPCPYIFKEIPVEILGQVYEQFLGQVIRLTPGHQARVEEKPEVRKAGGVYYTPKYIVDYIVANTVGKLLEGKTPAEAAALKIVDPACGSGSFLLGAFRCLIDWHENWYVTNDPAKWTRGKAPALNEVTNGYRLTTLKKKEILLNNLHGVDIDAQAVEVTKLSLLLKVLEEESGQLSLGLERALPDLGKNIQCGNSLIGWDYFAGRLTVDPTERRRVNPFDWQTAFPQVFAQGGFDAVIGNPPYLKEANNRELFDGLRRASIKKYCVGKMDLWYAFACKSLDIVRNYGYHSFIATNNWITNTGARVLRHKFLSESRFNQFVDFADFQVFQDASIQTMVYVVQKIAVKSPYEVNYLKVTNKAIEQFTLSKFLENPGNEELGWIISRVDPDKNNEPFTLTSINIDSILKKIENEGHIFLEEYEIGNGIDVLQDFVTKNHLPKLKPGISIGDGVFVISNSEKDNVVETENDIRKVKPYYTTNEINRYRADSNNRFWVIYADKEVREDIKNFPGIRKHLNKFIPILTSAFAPYGLHRPRDENYFVGDKILSVRKTRQGSFSLVTFPCYVSRAFLIIKPVRREIPLHYLLGILNSRLSNFWLYYRGKKQGDQLQVDKEPLLRFPIHQFNRCTNQEQIINLVKRMLDLHKSNPATPQEQEHLRREIESTDRQIDQLVYQLYGLTDEEIRIVEGGS